MAFNEANNSIFLEGESPTLKTSCSFSYLYKSTLLLLLLLLQENDIESYSYKHFVFFSHCFLNERY